MFDRKVISTIVDCTNSRFSHDRGAELTDEIEIISYTYTSYTSNLEIYAGKQPKGLYEVNNSPGEVVKRMVEPILGTCRNVTLDNWFTSVPLAEDLLQSKLTLVRTIKENKKGIAVADGLHKKQGGG
ncbi:hypothetical protein J437_LFUL016267 [Ladona fulva]|uniref:PiggyBac transposable element-derived protein domain-containing protein n=1 Tax=Ladona fulva TaxID=123851 RepID=A0A8K0KJE3_LADFU|nr:hypothetical protein J437_LFUL016267 [Ladona fulva]